MSAEFDWAIAAVKLEDERRAEQWFTAVCESYQGPTMEEPVPDWTVFIMALYDKAAEVQFDNETVNWFVEGLADRASDPLAVVKDMFEQRADLVARYMELSAATMESAAGADVEKWDPETAAEWYRYLTESWGGWSGVEEDWEQFTVDFLATAEQLEVRPQAATLVARIGEASDKVAAFAEYGLTIVPVGLAPPADDVPAVPDSEPPLPPGVDAEAAQRRREWTAFLEKNKGRWKGTDSSWTFFSGWLAAEARGQGFAEEATEFLEYAESLDDKADAFAAYGVTVPGVIEAEEEDEAASPEVEEAMEVLQTSIAELLDEHPEFAEIPEERRQELLAEVLQEMSAE